MRIAKIGATFREFTWTNGTQNDCHSLTVMDKRRVAATHLRNKELHCLCNK